MAKIPIRFNSSCLAVACQTVSRLGHVHNISLMSMCRCNYVSQVYWQQLRQPLAKRRREPLSPSGRDDVVDVVEPDLGSYAPTTKAAPGSHTPKPRRKIKVPDIFREKTAFEARSRVMCKS